MLRLGQLIVAKVFVGNVVPVKNENKYVKHDLFVYSYSQAFVHYVIVFRTF